MYVVVDLLICDVEVIVRRPIWGSFMINDGIYRSQRCETGLWLRSSQMEFAGLWVLASQCHQHRSRSTPTPPPHPTLNDRAALPPFNCCCKDREEDWRKRVMFSVSSQLNEGKKQKEDGETKAALADRVRCLRAQIVDWLGLPSVPLWFIISGTR